MAQPTAILSVGADTSQLEKDIQSALSRVNKTATLNLSTAGKLPLGKLTGEVSEFDKSMAAANARVLAFGASVGVIGAVGATFAAVVKNLEDVDRELRDINVLLNQSSDGIEKFGGKLFDIARNTGQSFQAVAGAAKEFSRQGLSLEETLKRTSDALILTRLSGLSFEDSVKSLTATVNGFAAEALTTTEVINKLANVDAAFAVSSKDLVEGLSRVGASAQSAGVSFDQLIALIASAQQATARGGSVIGNAFKSIFTRLQRGSNLDSLEQMGISVRDTTGAMLPALDILKELAVKYQTLSDAQKASTAEMLGGVFQINQTKALLNDLAKTYSIYDQALKVSTESTNEAIQRNEELNKSIAALKNEAIQNFTQITATVGKFTVEPVIRNILGAFNNLSNIVTQGGNLEIGEKIGKGILTGIGNALSGPAIVAVSALIGKLFLDFTKFASSSASGLLLVNKGLEQQAQLQQAINNILRENPKISQLIEGNLLSRIQKEKIILDLIIQQQNATKILQSTSASIASGIIGQGYKISQATGLQKVLPKKASGHIPVLDVLSEVIGAKQSGYNINPSNVRSMQAKIDGKNQTVIYNNKETVIPNFAGTGEPLILPPNKTIGELISEKSFASGFSPSSKDASKLISEKLLKLENRKPAKLSYGNLKGGLAGYYASNKNIIRVNKNLEEPDKRATIFHERLHEVVRKADLLPIFSELAPAKDFDKESINFLAEVYGKKKIAQYYKKNRMNLEEAMVLGSEMKLFQKNKMEKLSKKYPTVKLVSDAMVGGLGLASQKKYLGSPSNILGLYGKHDGFIPNFALKIGKILGGGYSVKSLDKKSNFASIQNEYGKTTNLSYTELDRISKMSESARLASLEQFFLSQLMSEAKAETPLSKARRAERRGRVNPYVGSEYVGDELAKKIRKNAAISNTLSAFDPRGEAGYSKGFVPNFISPDVAAPLTKFLEMEKLDDRFKLTEVSILKALQKKYPKAFNREGRLNYIIVKHGEGIRKSIEGHLNLLDNLRQNKNIDLKNIDPVSLHSIIKNISDYQVKGYGKMGDFVGYKTPKGNTHGLLPVTTSLEDMLSGILENKKTKFSSGYSPLLDAIQREQFALDQRGSKAKILIDQHKALRNPKNPLGLLVRNSVDEKNTNDIFKTSKGKNPQTFGMSSGFIPNFATPENLSLSQLKLLFNKIKDTDKASGYIQKILSQASLDASQKKDALLEIQKVTEQRAKKELFTKGFNKSFGEETPQLQSIKKINALISNEIEKLDKSLEVVPQSISETSKKVVKQTKINTTDLSKKSPQQIKGLFNTVNSEQQASRYIEEAVKKVSSQSVLPSAKISQQQVVKTMLGEMSGVIENRAKKELFTKGFNKNFGEETSKSVTLSNISKTLAEQTQKTNRTLEILPTKFEKTATKISKVANFAQIRSNIRGREESVMRPYNEGVARVKYIEDFIKNKEEAEALRIQGILDRKRVVNEKTVSNIIPALQTRKANIEREAISQASLKISGFVSRRDEAIRFKRFQKVSPTIDRLIRESSEKDLTQKGFMPLFTNKASNLEKTAERIAKSRVLSAQEKAGFESQIQAERKNIAIQRGAKRQQAAFGASFALPFVGGIASQFATEDKTKNLINEISTGVGSGLMLAAFGGPVGIGIGATVAGLSTVASVMKNLDDSARQTALSLEKVVEKNSLLVSSLSEFSQVSAQIQDSNLLGRNTDPKLQKKLQNSFIETISNIRSNNPDLANQLLNTSIGSKEQDLLISRGLELSSKTTNFSKGLQSLLLGIEEKKGFSNFYEGRVNKQDLKNLQDISKNIFLSKISNLEENKSGSGQDFTQRSLVTLNRLITLSSDIDNRQRGARKFFNFGKDSPINLLQDFNKLRSQAKTDVDKILKESGIDLSQADVRDKKGNRIESTDFINSVKNVEDLTSVLKTFFDAIKDASKEFKEFASKVAENIKEAENQQTKFRKLLAKISIDATRNRTDKEIGFNKDSFQQEKELSRRIQRLNLSESFITPNRRIQEKLSIDQEQLNTSFLRDALSIGGKKLELQQKKDIEIATKIQEENAQNNEIQKKNIEEQINQKYSSELFELDEQLRILTENKKIQEQRLVFQSQLLEKEALINKELEKSRLEIKNSLAKNRLGILNAQKSIKDTDISIKSFGFSSRTGSSLNQNQLDFLEFGGIKTQEEKIKIRAKEELAILKENQNINRIQLENLKLERAILESKAKNAVEEGLVSKSEIDSLFQQNSIASNINQIGLSGANEPLTDIDQTLLSMESLDDILNKLSNSINSMAGSGNLELLNKSTESSRQYLKSLQDRINVDSNFLALQAKLVRAIELSTEKEKLRLALIQGQSTETLRGLNQSIGLLASIDATKSGNPTSAFFGAIGSEIARNQNDMTDLFALTKDGIRTTKDELSSAFTSLAQGTASIEDAFRRLILNIASQVQERAIKAGTDRAFDGIFSSVLGSFSPQTAKYFGGSVGKYASGGKVKGKEGIDKVPALLSNGEFVIKKSSVNKYGEDFLSKVNAGIIKMASGGSVSEKVNLLPLGSLNYKDYQNKPTGLSDFGFINPDLVTTETRRKLERLELKNQEAREEMARQKRAYDKQLQSAFIGSFVSAAFTIAGSAASMGGGSPNSSGGYSSLGGAQKAAPFAGGFSKSGGSFFPKARPFAFGGQAIGSDTVPAMLTNGEYVINKDMVNLYGKSFLDRINRGSIPYQKTSYLQSGGLVGREASQPSMTSGGKGNTNNINITINTGMNGEKTSQESGNQQDSTEEAKRMKQLSKEIESVVVATIEKHSRSGGILNKR